MSSDRKARPIAVTRITLAVDERRDRADITLPRTSAIAGQLTDEYGDPIEGVTIRLYQIRFASGRRRLVDVPGASSSRTDDLGRYRVFGLRPGSYVLAAYVGQLVLGQPGAADIPGLRHDLLIPGRRTHPESRLVPVPASQDVDGLNFAVSRIATSTVSGVALDCDGRSDHRRTAPQLEPPIRRAARRRRSAPTFGLTDRSSSATWLPGSTSFRPTAAGVKASEEGEFAAVPVTVSGSDVKGLVVQTSPGSTIAGRFTFDDPEAPASRNITLSAIPSDAGPGAARRKLRARGRAQRLVVRDVGHQRSAAAASAAGAAGLGAGANPGERRGRDRHAACHSAPTISP